MMRIRRTAEFFSVLLLAGHLSAAVAVVLDESPVAPASAAEVKKQREATGAEQAIPPSEQVKPSDKSAEAQVKQRAGARWQALIEGRLETAYGFLSPAYRQAVPYTHFQRKIRGVGLWKRAEVESVGCEADRCQVQVHIYIEMRHRRFPDPIKSDSLVDESWIRVPESGEWWYQPDLS